MTEQRSCLDAFQSEFDYLCRTLRRLGARPQDLDDDLQNVFLVLSRKWSEYDPSRPLRPYLVGIAFRVVAARKRRHWRELPGEVEEVAGTGAAPDEALGAADARALVLSALARVPMPRRVVLVMHDLDEMPMRDITKALSIPLFTGYSRLRKARREFEGAVRALRKERPAP